jgi:hypothetical protein
MIVVQPHTEVAPILLEPQTPLPVPHVPRAALPVFSLGALLFELEELERSLFSPEPNPYDRLDGKGEVVRLFMA